MKKSSYIRYTNQKNQKVSFNSFLCKNGFILYKVVRKNDANFFLEYNEEENYYVVICNKTVSDEIIKQYVLNNYEWVLKWYKNLDNPAPWFIFGQKIPVKIILGNKFGVNYLDNKINVYLKHKRDYKIAVAKFYKEFGTAYLSQRLVELLQKLGLNGRFGKVSWATYYYGRCYSDKPLIWAPN